MDELRVLEQTRLRLQNLTHSLASFKHDLQMNNPLPNPQSLQASAVILKGHTTYLLDHLNKQSSLFQRLAVHPSSNYPGRTQEAVQTQLLRKKLDPQIELLVEAARDEALAAGISPDKSFVSQERLLAEQEREKAMRRQAKFGFSMGDEADEGSEDEGSSEDSSGGEDEGGDRVNEPIGLGDVWVDCAAWSRQRLAKFATEEGESLYTAEEREMGIENVRTGLRRSLEEEEESDEEDEDEEDGEGDTAMRDSAPAAAPSSGQTAGQPGLGGVGQNVLFNRPEEDAKEWMMALAAYGARGEDVSAPMMGGAGYFPPRR
ncbi:mediator of RNA polymerase II transcription subunit 8 [Gnomoniopsis smithogilvyi]|uniref:Mediator of RNA polymerase II transcription subunit 8 n=1 Tax=Gnomoniopsis smithogilvyi TaxID=1191159 RepID=A0A9W8Z069_9PEZI|nr:mediator of RNA polymerase II transcription subunit 8 [Gnomoniopsis smithogilvyi]